MDFIIEMATGHYEAHISENLLVYVPHTYKAEPGDFQYKYDGAEHFANAVAILLNSGANLAPAKGGHIDVQA